MAAWAQEAAAMSRRLQPCTSILQISVAKQRTMVHADQPSRRRINNLVANRLITTNWADSE
jgi:hypothetical protein